MGIISPATIDGYKYFWLFKDVCTGFNHVYLSANKDSNTFLEALDECITWYRSHSKTVKKLRTDDEPLFKAANIVEYLRRPDINIKHQSSVPYCHWQNAVERDVQTIVKGTSTLLHSQPWLGANQWNLALYHFISIRNRTPNNKHTQSPHQMITGQALDFENSFKFAFGDFVAVGIPDVNKTWKFDLKNELGIYVGDADDYKRGCTLYMPYHRNLQLSLDCVKLEITDRQYLHYMSRRQDIRDPTRYSTIEGAFHDFGEALAEESIELPSFSAPLYDTEEPQADIPRKKPAVQSNYGLRTRTTGSVQDSASSGAQVDHSPSHTSINFEDHSHIVSYGAKVTVGLALKSLERDMWIQAINAEIQQLLTGRTLIPTAPTDLPESYDIIHSTMQLKHKFMPSGEHDKFKARLCACGNELRGLIEDTFSPTISNLANAALHQIAVIDQMHTCIIDTVGAYLYEDYPQDLKPIFLRLPREVAITCNLNPNVIYRINKYLYGLPDSGRAYYRAYSSHLMNKGYARTASDPCLFTKIEGDRRTYIWIHVDDSFVASTHQDELMKLQDCIREKYQITVNNDANQYLGINFEKLPNGNVKLTQPKLLQSIIDEFSDYLSTHRSNANYSTPQSGTTKRSAAVMEVESSSTVDNSPIEPHIYLHLLGALIYLTRSRPDISTAISFAAVHASKPTRVHYDELLHCVKYLEDTRDKGLILHIGDHATSDLTIKAYVDASYLTHADSKSHTGYCISFGTIGSFYTKSLKQKLVATSSVHAEMRALYTAVIDIVFLIHLCDEIGRPVNLPAVILEDNQPLIDLSVDISTRTKKCKHFLMLIDYVREQVEEGLIALSKVSSADNLADILTKVVTGKPFITKADQILGEF